MTKAEQAIGKLNESMVVTVTELAHMGTAQIRDRDVLRTVEQRVFEIDKRLDRLEHAANERNRAMKDAGSRRVVLVAASVGVVAALLGAIVGPLVTTLLARLFKP